MPKRYFILFCILLFIPVAGAIAAVSYFCFKISVAAGAIALTACLVVTAVAVIAVTVVSNKKR